MVSTSGSSGIESSPACQRLYFLLEARGCFHHRIGLEWIQEAKTVVYPEDRVLVAFVPTPADFVIIRDQGWYRIPQRRAPKGLTSEYYAFYFGRRFGDERWTITYFAQVAGLELVRRCDLLPAEMDHPRASDLYYRVALGPIQKLPRPIVSLRWRRIAFVHTTWDRFMDAREINDLFVAGGEYFDRLYASLKDLGFQPEFRYLAAPDDPAGGVKLALMCARGRLDLLAQEGPAEEAQMDDYLMAIERRVSELGGEQKPRPSGQRGVTE
jgi:hypothetical protein